MVEVKMKRLERTPSSLPLPDPNAVLCNLSWLSGLSTEVLDTIHSYAKLMQFEHRDVMIHQGDSARGIYIIVSGLVKVRDMALMVGGSRVSSDFSNGGLGTGLSGREAHKCLTSLPHI